MAYKGRIFASINRFGQETTSHVRPMQRGENVKLKTSHNAVVETVRPDRPVKLMLCTVHPNDLK